MLGSREIVDGKVKSSLHYKSFLKFSCHSLTGHGLTYLNAGMLLWHLTAWQVQVANLQRSIWHGDQSRKFYPQLWLWRSKSYVSSLDYQKMKPCFVFGYFNSVFFFVWYSNYWILCTCWVVHYLISTISIDVQCQICVVSCNW